MGVNSLPKTVTRQRRGCDLNPGPSAPESQHVNHSASEPPYTSRKLKYARATKMVAKQTENNKLTNLTISINSQHIQHDEVGNT